MNRYGPGACVCRVCGVRLLEIEQLALAVIRVTSAPQPVDARLIAALDKALAAYLRQQP
jgi:hypothetical protein